MRNEAQITIETVILIGFFLLVLVGVTITLNFNVSSAGRDASRALEMRSNLDAIVSAIEAVQALGPGAERTFWIVSNQKTWGIVAGEIPGYTQKGSLSYWVRWESRHGVPDELLSATVVTGTPLSGATYAGLARMVEGTNTSTPVGIGYVGTGQGRFKVVVLNNNTGGGNATLSISSSGRLITITLEVP